MYSSKHVFVYGAKPDRQLARGVQMQVVRIFQIQVGMHNGMCYRCKSTQKPQMSKKASYLAIQSRAANVKKASYLAIYNREHASRGLTHGRSRHKGGISTCDS